MSEARTQAARGLSVLFHISRFHIIVIAMAANLTFGWVLTGGHDLVLPLIVGLDWFLVNLLNRVVDLKEDRINGVVGTGFVDQHARALTWGCWGLMAASFPIIHLLYPELLGWRLLFQLIGIAYNYRIVPWPGGRTRFKEMYLFKNVSSGLLFILSGILYPAVAGEALASTPISELVCLMLFFLAMDLTYEIFYDLRDLAGDRAEGVPTFPVVHGEEKALAIVRGLLWFAGTVLVLGFLGGVLRFSELVMVAGPIQQAIFYKLKARGGLTQADCVNVTWLGAAQLMSFNAWIWLGLPLEPAGWG